MFLLILESEKGREKEKHQCERNINGLPPAQNPTGEATCNLTVCPAQESKPQCFGLQDGTAAGRATFPGQLSHYD